MRISLTNAIDQYLKACKNTNWIAKEAYKFEFANFILQQVAWDAQSDEEILQTLIQSQKIKYSGADNARGIQFVQKSGRETLKEFIRVQDVALFRQIHSGTSLEALPWKNRTMSFTGLSA